MLAGLDVVRFRDACTSVVIAVVADKVSNVCSGDGGCKQTIGMCRQVTRIESSPGMPHDTYAPGINHARGRHFLDRRGDGLNHRRAWLSRCKHDVGFENEIL